MTEKAECGGCALSDEDGETAVAHKRRGIPADVPDTSVGIGFRIGGLCVARLDDIGTAAVSAAARSGAEIPEEIAVVSVDDDPEICEKCSPTLSSVRPDFQRLGFCEGWLLDETMSNPGQPPRALTVPPFGIIRRASSRRLKVFDKMVYAALEKIRSPPSRTSAGGRATWRSARRSGRALGSLRSDGARALIHARIGRLWYNSNIRLMPRFLRRGVRIL